MDDTPSTNETQRRMLEAGIDLWQSKTAAEMFAGLTVASVSKAAGVTRSTFYSYWPSTQEYLNDVVDHLAEAESRRSRLANNAMLERLNVAGPNLVHKLLEAYQRRLEDHMEDPLLRLRIGFLSQIDDPEIAARLRRLNERNEDVRGSKFTFMSDSWSREPRPPLDARQIQTVLTVLRDGLAARRILEPDHVPAELYGFVVMSLMMIITRRADDPREMEEVLEAVNNWPAIGIALASKATVDERWSVRDSMDSTKARQLTEAIRRMTTTVGWTELSMAEVALVTGAPETTLIQTFGSKAGLAIAIFWLNVAERFAEIDPSERAIDHLREMIDVTIDELRRSPALTQSLLMIISGSASAPLTDLMDWDRRPDLVDAIRLAQQEGDLDADLDADQLGAALGRVLLIDNVPLPGARDTACDAVELFLLGAGAPPRNR